MPKLDTIRAFVAVNLSLEATQAVLDKRKSLIAEIESLPLKVSWVSPSNIHITMKFLGNVDRELGDGVTSMLRKVGGEVGPFFVKVAGWGAFPTSQRPRVLWVSLEDPTEGLTALHNALELHLGEMGFKKEKRVFHPHVTVGRVRKGKEDLSPILEKLVPEDSVESSVSELVLYESRLRRKGAEYRVLGRADLTGTKGEG